MKAFNKLVKWKWYKSDVLGHREAGLAPMYAHRGYHDKPQIPENSLPAFIRAREHGFPVEFDVHMIADGSLVIFHDDNLRRQTGVEGNIVDYDITNLRKLRLEGTDEVIPTFDEVLDVFEGTGIPLLIELKVDRGNYKELAKSVCRRLDSYNGDFVIESFDPRALMTVRSFRPEIRRGQLAQNFYKHPEGLPAYQVGVLTNMMFNAFVNPDFVAYRFEDRDNKALRRTVDKKGVKEAAWTIRSPKQYKAAVKAGCTAIFEKFDPTEVEL